MVAVFFFYIIKRGSNLGNRERKGGRRRGERLIRTRQRRRSVRFERGRRGRGRGRGRRRKRR